MEDISKRKPAFGRSGLGIVAGSIIIGALFGALWLSFTNTDDPSGGAEQVQNQGNTADGPAELTIEHANLDPTAGQTDQDAAGEIVPDDDVDIILGGSWRNHDCTYVTIEVFKPSTGELVDALECQRTPPRVAHEYEGYSNKTLESLAYSDPLASLELGRRAAQNAPDKSWDLMIRSSALLGGDSRPIRWLATRSFNQVENNGEVSVGTLELRYVLDRLAERLDGIVDPSVDFREEYLRENLSEEKFEQLNRAVDGLLENMKAIEEQTTGKSTIQGAG